MPALIEAINVKRKSLFEHENAPYACLDVRRLHAHRARRPDARPLKTRNCSPTQSSTRPSRPAKVPRARPRHRSRTTFPLHVTPTASTSSIRNSFETLTLSDSKVGDAARLPHRRLSSSSSQVQRQPHRPATFPRTSTSPSPIPSPPSVATHRAGATKIAAPRNRPRDQGPALPHHRRARPRLH